MNCISIAHLTVEKLKEVICFAPSLPEQEAIAAFLDEKMARIDTLYARIRCLPPLLEEYRTSIITAAVTGQIKVTEAMQHRKCA